MSVRMTKVMLALGLMAAAGSSNAFYVLSANGSLPYSRYCAQVWRGTAGMGVMESTLAKCQDRLNDAIALMSPASSVEACHMCVQKFADALVVDTGSTTGTATELPGEAVRRFLEGTRTLREQFRIDEYERAQIELERSLSPAPKP